MAGSFICDDLGKAKALNNFFVSIGSSVEKKIPAAKSSFSLFLGERKLNNFHVINVTKDEVLENIKKLGKNKSSGPFSIPVNILKDYTSILADPLVYIINKSLNEGIFPTLLKSARVCPIYKKGDRFKCENYRPISLLSNVSKIFERIFHDQLSKFLKDNDLVYKLQFGFRKKYSTNHALLSIVEQIRNYLDNGIFACGVFVDLWYK